MYVEQTPVSYTHLDVYKRQRYDTVKHILHLLGLDSKLDQLLKEDTVHYLDHNRDVRLDTTKANQAGMYWTDTHDALELCLREFGMIR